MKANASQFWRNYLWLWLLTAGLLLGWATGLFEDDKTGQPRTVRKDQPGYGSDSNIGTKRSKEDGSFLKALPGILIIAGIVILVRKHRGKKRMRQQATREQERGMLAAMPPAQRDVYMRQQQLELERQKAATEQKRQEGLKTDSIALGALGWHLANRQREATEDQTKAIKDQTEELKRQKR